jgi:ParB-like chromosome segregation protein Spo0J
MESETFKTRLANLFPNQATAATDLGLSIDQVKKMASGATPIQGERLELIERVFREAERDLALKPAGIVLIDIDQLENDPTNFRSTMDPDKLAELADSIEVHGVRQNLEAYETQPGLGGEMYLVPVGNRRLAATRKVVDRLAKTDPELAAKRRLVPVRILKTPEEIETAKEVQLVENLQREDISPADEARGFVWLSEHKEQSPAAIAKRIGVSARLVSQRMTMIRAPKVALDALEAGKIGTRHCEIIGRIPTESDRNRAAKMILKPKGLDRPLNKLETIALVRSEFMVGLQDAPFDPEDAKLDPNAGACGPCPYRTANMEGLDAELSEGGRGKVSGGGISPRVCTNPTCFRNKADLAWDRERDRAEQSGQVVLGDDEAARVFAGPGGAVAFDSKLVPLDSKPTSKDVGHYAEDKNPTWDQVLKSHGSPVEPILARHPQTGKPVALVDREAIKDLVKATAKEQGNGSTLFDKADGDQKKKQEAQKRDREQKKRNLEKALGNAAGMANLIATKPESVPDVLKALIGVTCSNSDDATFVLGRWLEIPNLKGKPQPVGIVEFMDETPFQSVEALVGYLTVAVLGSAIRWNGIDDPDFQDIAQLVGFTLNPSTDEN